MTELVNHSNHKLNTQSFNQLINHPSKASFIPTSFINAKINQMPKVVKSWFDDATLYELAEQSLADDIERLYSDELAKKYAEHMDTLGGISQVTDNAAYKNRLIELPELGKAICGIRFRAMDISKPFVTVAVTTNPLTIEGLVQSLPIIKQAFATFNPQYIQIIVSNDSELDAQAFNEQGIHITYDRMLIGNTLQALAAHNEVYKNSKIVSLSQQGFELELIDFSQQDKFKHIYDAYQQGYDQLFSQKPELQDYTFCHSFEDLADISQTGGFNFVLFYQGDFAGLISLNPSTYQYAGVQGIYVNEKFIVPKLHGKGIGKAFEQWVINTLIERRLTSSNTVYFGEIDYANKGSLHSAYAVGRVEIARKVWMPL